jgi:hypothetical protein
MHVQDFSWENGAIENHADTACEAGKIGVDAPQQNYGEGYGAMRYVYAPQKAYNNSV